MKVHTGKTVAGIDIGGTKTLIFIADGEGNIVDKRKVPTPASAVPDELFSYLMEQIDERLTQLGSDRTMLAGIGIGLPGVVDFHSGIADNCTALGWGETDVRKVMRAYVDCPVFVDNDVKISALGEWWIGAAKGVSDFTMIAIGTGIGSAIVAGGSLLRGSRFAAGEIGYLLQDDTFADDFRQDYSTFGSLERIASGTGIAAAARQALAAHEGPTLLRERFGADAESVRADHVLHAAAAGDELALNILRLPLRHLSMAIANVAALLNPELIVIGGGVADSGPLLLERLQQQAERLSPNPVKLVPARLGNEAGAAGAVFLALQNRKEQFDGNDRYSSGR